MNEALFEEAKKLQNFDELKTFLEKISKTPFDYDTVVHAVVAAGLSAMWTMDRVGGGISGFQAGCVIWDVIDKWDAFSRGPKRMLCYDDLLYPQYAHKFVCISKDTWEHVQKKAKESIAEKDGFVSPRVVEHWKSIVEGQIPFGLRVEA